VFGCFGTSRDSLRGSSSTTSTTPRVRVPRHVARLVTRLVVDYFTYAVRPGASAHRAAHHLARRRLLHLRRTSSCFGTSRGLSRDSSLTTSPRAGSSSTTSPTPRVRVPRHIARLVTRLRRASGSFGTSRGLSRDSSSTTSPRAGSSSTTSPTPRVRVPLHVARLVTRLVVDYFDYAARPGASARCVARHPARRRLLHLRRVSGCFSTSRGLSRDSSSTTSPRAGSSSTTSPTSCVRVPQHAARLVTPCGRVPQHVARLVMPLVVDYFAYAARPGASTHHVAHLAAHRRLFRLRRASGCLGTSCGSSRGSSSTTLCAKTSSCGHTGSTSATPCVATACLAKTLARHQLRRAPPRRRLLVASCRLFISTSRERKSRPQHLVRINSD
jgi:hypothetical protein